MNENSDDAMMRAQMQAVQRAMMEDTKGGPVPRSALSRLLQPQRLEGEDYSTYWTRRLQGQRAAYVSVHGRMGWPTSGPGAQGTYRNQEPKDQFRKQAIAVLGRRQGIAAVKYDRRAAKEAGA